MPESGQQQGINSAELYREVKGKYGIVHKGRYEDYLLDELIPFVDNTFHTILDRSARYIGGISSGGYTALSIGLRHQELFSKIGGHMQAIDLSYADEDECYFADETMWLKNDPFLLRNRHFSIICKYSWTMEKKTRGSSIVPAKSCFNCCSRTEPMCKTICLRGITAETTSDLTWKPISGFIARVHIPAYGGVNNYGKHYMADNNGTSKYAVYWYRSLCLETEKANVVLVRKYSKGI